MKQIMFRDTDNNVIHGGIRLDDGDVICCCCGGLIPSDEQTPELGFELIKEFCNWINLDDAILNI